MEEFDLWALGDIMSPYPLKHMANMEARTTAYNVLHPEDQRSASYEATPMRSLPRHRWRARG